MRGIRGILVLTVRNRYDWASICLGIALSKIFRYFRATESQAHRDLTARIAHGLGAWNFTENIDYIVSYTSTGNKIIY